MQYLQKSEVAKLFRAAHAANKTHHLAMLCEFFLGTRISQVLSICGEDVFQQDGRWVVLIRAAKRGNQAVRAIHIDSDPAFDMTPIIELAKTKGRSLLFGGLTRQYVNLCMKRYAEIAGIHSSFAHSHVLRHSIAMIVYDATQRIGAVSEFLCHKSPGSAFYYLRENDNQLAQDAVDELQLA
jgi:integrase